MNSSKDENFKASDKRLSFILFSYSPNNMFSNIVLSKM